MRSVVEFGKLLHYADGTALICSGLDVDTVNRQLTHDLPLHVFLDIIKSNETKY